MTTLHVLPYTMEHYNFLPELYIAKEQFESARASGILFAEIGQVFIKHHVKNILGITLLHNHFLLEQHAMLVNMDSVALPWDATNGASELAGVSASAWRFTNQGLAPYEFAYAAVEVSLHHHSMQSFLLELRAILEKHNLANILGICSLGKRFIDRPIAIKFTSGRANTTLPFDNAPHDGNVIDAI